MMGGYLYVGGVYSAGGIVMDTRLPRWDGTRWSSVPGGIQGPMAVSNGKLYVAGTFRREHGAAADLLASWDGSRWTNLGSGLRRESDLGFVSTLTSLGDDLYVGGYFTEAGGISAKNLAKWNGESWSSVGEGVNGTVRTLATHGSDLYVATSEDSGLPPSLTRWDGQAWYRIESGLNQVDSLAGLGNTLFVVGEFLSTAGGKVSAYMARLNLLSLGEIRDPSFSASTGFRFQFLDGTPGATYSIQSSASLDPGGWTRLKEFIYNGPTWIEDPSAVPESVRFYRAVPNP